MSQGLSTGETRTGVEVSVIIPTYNRRDLLRACLAALEAQTHPLSQIEVIVVDDGSTDDTLSLLSGPHRPDTQTITQQHQGQVAALNRGAQIARGDLLVFLDDDAIVPPGFIACILDVHRLHPRALVLPVVEPACVDPANRFARFAIKERHDLLARQVRRTSGDQPLPAKFTDLIGCCFTVKKADLFALGGMRTLPGNLWPDWNDVDFAYRAAAQGFAFWLCPSLTVFHFESGITSRQAACDRAFNAARSAPWLFQRHPDLIGHLPMFRDKTPIAWRRDPLPLIGRKIARQIASSAPAQALMARAGAFLERRAPESALLARLYRWTISGCILRGYRAGLQDLAAASAPGPHTGATPS